MAGELRRVVALLPGASTASHGPDLLIWNASGAPARDWGALGERLSLQERVCEYPADLGLANGAPAAAGQFAAAAALAVSDMSGQVPAVDFLHPRLNPRTKVPLRRRIVLGGSVAAAILLACLALLLAWQGEMQEIQDLRDRLDGMQDALAAARDVVDKAAFARNWYDQRPRHLDCLRELTLAFPAEGRVWATGLAISEDRRVMLSGKAADERAVLEVLDRLKGNPRLSDVKPIYIRDAGNGAREKSFAVSFSFVQAEKS
jgi:hypothetical protein